jgi:chaperonin GroES
MRFRPLGERVLIKRKEEKTTKTGILIPETTKDKPLEGTVIAVGEEVSNIKAGDNVLFGKYSGNDIIVDGVDYILLLNEDVSGVLESE